MKKKIALVVCAMALVSIISVCGTMAYLTARTNGGEGVVNTFVSSGGMLDKDGTFEIEESAVKIDPDTGKVIVDTEADPSTTGNTYNVLPDTTVPKDAKVVITKKSSVPAYLYVEVDDKLNKSVYTWEIDDTKWAPVKDSQGADVVGKNGKPLYVYSKVLTTDEETSKPLTYEAISVAEDASVDIVKGGKVTVADTTEEALAALENQTITFYAYLAQKSVGTPAEAFVACFPAE